MLRELRVRNVALLEDVCVPLDAGFCVVTGATGSGKSLLVAALDVLLGGRFTREMLRTGAEEARVEGLFEIADPALRERLGELVGGDASELVLRRRVDASGRNRCEAQGSLVPVASLRAIGRLLVEIHGQSEHQALADPSEQALLLDRAGGLDARRAAYADRLDAWNAARERLASATTGDAARAARLSALDAVAREVRAADLRPGEQDELRRERTLLADAERHARSIAEALALLDGGDDGEGAIDRLGRAARALDVTAGLDPQVREALEAVGDAAARASDASRTLGAAADRIESDPARLEEVDERLATIGAVLRRHGPTEDDALAALAAAEAESARLHADAGDASELASRLAERTGELLAAGDALDAARRSAAGPFAAGVRAALEELGMPGTRFEVAIAATEGPPAERAARATRLGLARVEFLVSPNRGEDLRPMAKIASGGELARIALAIRGQLTGGPGAPLLVFDEIDADVGPRLGSVIGGRLRRLAEGRQVLAVTHLPQVAEAAHHHLHVAKRAEGDRTVAQVERLEGRRRAQEIDEMRGEGRRRKASPRA